MRGLLTTREQEGWRELIHKEASCRVSWRAKYGHRYPRRVLDHGVPRRKGFLPAIGLPAEATGSAEHQDIAVQRQEEQQLPGEKGALRPLEPLPEMRASTPQTQRLLYQGFSHEGRGRAHYLKERRKKSPEEKFSYPVLSSWEYGWRFGDIAKGIKTPVHGKSRIVKDTFYFKNGIFYHPSKTDKLS